ncbi:MAG: 2-C-methyl-D-erythritol 2,4-cyclodiphosphate synthase [Chlamydiae bacterium]|nr:2-C-methyl-D-erythritol 2,4-cyclodiphosphate synthase [Chlamydiota bacterium]
MIRVGYGQDAHKFLKSPSAKKCIIGGLVFDDVEGLDADSDGDIVYHAICNAITSITHVPILGDVAIKMCKEENITDSFQYLKKALATLGEWKIVFVALAIEAKRPKFQKRALELRQSVAGALGIDVDLVGITFTSGQELTHFGQGLGVECRAVVTFIKSIHV